MPPLPPPLQNRYSHRSRLEPIIFGIYDDRRYFFTLQGNGQGTARLDHWAVGRIKPDVIVTLWDCKMLCILESKFVKII